MARILRSCQRLRCVAGCSVWSLGVLLAGSMVSMGMSQTLALPGASVSEFECVIEPQQVVKLASLKAEGARAAPGARA